MYFKIKIITLFRFYSLQKKREKEEKKTVRFLRRNLSSLENLLIGRDGIGKGPWDLL
jgi:hypothetical protein